MAGQFHLFLTDEEIEGTIFSSRPSLGDLRDRITALVAADVPLDARIVAFRNDSLLRIEIGFEKPEDLEPEATEVLLDRLCDPSTTPDNRALIRTEILSRIKAQAAR